MNKTTRWNRTEIETLISLYESEPFLYDTKHEDYHNRIKRDRVITEIAEKINEVRGNKLTLHDVKSKIKTLRTQYGAEKMHMAEKLREISAGPRGDGVMEMYVPRLWCYGNLKFLDDYTRDKPNEPSGEEVQVIIRSNVKNSSSFYLTYVIKKLFVHQISKKSVNRIMKSPFTERATATATSTSANHMIVCDKEDVFANFVAYELRQITDSKLFHETKWKIQLALREGIEKQIEMNAEGFITEVLVE